MPVEEIELNAGLETNENIEELTPLDSQNRQQGSPTSPSTLTKYSDWFKKNKKRIGLFLVATTVIIVIIVVSVISVGIRAFVEEENPKVSCTDDNFKRLEYNAPSLTDSTTNQRFLKYIFITSIHGQPLNFTNVLNKCKELNASLWQVLDGDPEWNAVLEKAKEENVIDVWLHGEVVGSCPGLSYQCQKEEAGQGNGLAVRWPSSYTASYTRLYVGASTEKSCIAVENKEPYLWTTDYCAEREHPGICVKRNCIKE